MKVLVGVGLGDEDATLIAERARRVTVLDLSFCPISDAGLRELERLPELDVLILGAAPVSDRGVAHFRDQKPECAIRRFPRNVCYEFVPPETTLWPVKEYAIQLKVFPPATDELVAQLSEFSEVNIFHASFMKVPADRGVTNHFELTDASLRSLSNLPLLEIVAMEDAEEMTDEGLRFLSKCGSLRHLALDMAHFTRQGVARFRSSLPACTVYGDY